MRTDFSKPSADIQQELNLRQTTAREQFQRQHQTAELLRTGSRRRHCLLCGANLSDGEHFSHRTIPFTQCGQCHHVQCDMIPPPGYPPLDFATVYPRLDPANYQDRKTRIYQPKLTWALEVLQEYGLDRDRLAAMRWVEIGAGAGYFLSTLQDAGFTSIKGLDADTGLVQAARAFVDPNNFFVHNGTLADALYDHPADIYVAFFVLEHVTDAAAFFEALGRLPAGTIFLFAVPIFGFSCLLENVFVNDYARNLDCVLHTQLYTDQSIRYAMDMAGFEMIGQWVFGQDATDLIRLIMVNLEGLYPKGLLEHFQQDVLPLQDLFQGCLDRQKFSDQRHIIAIKR